MTRHADVAEMGAEGAAIVVLAERGADGGLEELGLVAREVVARVGREDRCAPLVAEGEDYVEGAQGPLAEIDRLSAP